MIRHTFYYYVFVNLFSNICINPILIGIYINLYIILIIKWWNFFFSPYSTPKVKILVPSLIFIIIIESN